LAPKSVLKPGPNLQPPTPNMETVITRETDILREYLAALDDRERVLSPFAKLAATIKLARLRRELNNAELDTTDEDFRALRHEVDERLNRSLLRRFQASPWGARFSIFLILVAGQQLALGLIWLLTLLFVRFAPVPKQWNPVLPHEQPVFLWLFVFLFFFATPMLALLVLFGGRYLRAWRTTLPATLLILVSSAILTFMVVRTRETNNPVRHTSSLGQFAKEREVNSVSYGEWVKASWLMNDAKFQRDYERYFRNGPGRWITSRLISSDDAAWQPRTDEKDSLRIMNEYLDVGQDQEGFREWLRYYLDRNRIYAEDRIDQEVAALTGPANQRFLGIWQLEPYLKERDQRLYRAYLGSINTSMKTWGLIWLGVLALVFLGAYAATPVLSLVKMRSGSGRVRRESAELDSDGRIPSRPVDESYNSFPERGEITASPFVDAPYKLLSLVHRAFFRLAIFASLLVFGFWAVVYALELTSVHPNPSSQVALMRSNLLFAGSTDSDVSENGNSLSGVGSINSRGGQTAKASRETLLAAQVRELEQTLEEDDYQSDKKFKEQYRIIASQRSELNSIKSTTGQLEQVQQTLPEQISSVGSRVGAAEARAGEVMGQAEAARQAAENVQKQLGTKLTEVESRATRAAEQVGKVEDQASLLATRTEALEKELDRRARQIEARTEELGERTAGLKEREDRVDRLQRVAFAAILAELKSGADDLERRISSSFYRSFGKGEARRDVDALRQRITALTTELRAMNTDQAKQFIEQLDALGKRVDQIAERVK
jgi:hypothetical protein